MPERSGINRILKSTSSIELPATCDPSCPLYSVGKRQCLYPEDPIDVETRQKCLYDLSFNQVVDIEKLRQVINK